MIPLFATVQIGQMPRLWIPLFLVWFLLAPFLILLFPFYLIVCLVAGFPPLRLLKVCFEILGALKGTRVDIDQPSTSVHIVLR